MENKIINKNEGAKYQHQRNRNTSKMTGNKMMNVRENV
jgi:hypothetical protein